MILDNHAIRPARADAHPNCRIGRFFDGGIWAADNDGFVPRLQAALAAKGIAATVANAGVSGDTASDGLARLDWSVPQGTQAVIVELGANDMLRGVKPEVTRDALDKILQRLTARHIVVMLCGMRAAPNLGADYGQAFERIYPELAAKYGDAALSVFPRRRCRRPQTYPAGRHAPQCHRRRSHCRAILPDVLRLVDQIQRSTRHNGLRRVAVIPF